MFNLVCNSSLPTPRPLAWLLSFSNTMLNCECAACFLLAYFACVRYVSFLFLHLKPWIKTMVAFWLLLVFFLVFFSSHNNSKNGYALFHLVQKYSRFSSSSLFSVVCDLPVKTRRTFRRSRAVSVNL